MSQTQPIMKICRLVLVISCACPFVLADAQPDIKQLIHSLQKGEIDEKEHAAEALGAMGPAALPAAGALQKALNDELPYVRIHSAEALVKIGSDALPNLLVAIKNENAEVRAIAADGLGKCGQNSESAISALTNALHDKQLQVRGAAALALEDLAPTSPSALAALQTASHDEDTMVAAKAQEALSHVNAVTIGQHSKTVQVVKSTQKLTTAASPAVHEPLPSSHTVPLKKKVVSLAQKAVKKKKAAPTPPPPTPGELMVQLQSSTASIRETAELAIIRRSSETTSVLIQALQGGDTTLAELSAVVLEKIPTEDAKKSVESYRKHQQDKSIASLLKNLRQEGKLSEDAQTALVKIGAPVVGPVSQVLTDPKPASRRAAARVLRDIGILTAPATSAMITALDDSDQEVRMLCSEALSKTNTPESLSALRFFPIKEKFRRLLSIFKH